MKADKINLNSGYVKIFKYKIDKKIINDRVKPLIYDISNHSNYIGNIIWIYKVSTKQNFNIEDVLKEYIEKYYDKESLIFTQAGTLSLVPEAYGPIKNGLEGIRIEKEHLYKADFYNIIFNTIATKSYGNADTFIYIDDYSDKKFIQNNIGTQVEEKLINRIK